MVEIRSWDILMLEWEFAPELAGGLGVAGAGLAHALGREPRHLVHVVLPQQLPPAELGQLQMHCTGVVAAPACYPGYYDLSLRPAGADLGRVFSAGGNPAEKVAPQSALLDSLHICPEEDTSQKFFGMGYGGTLSSERVPPVPAAPAANDTAAPAPDFASVVHAYGIAADRVAAELVTLDVVHAHDWVTFPAALRIQARTHQPLVVHVHSLEEDRRGGVPDQQIAAVEAQGTAAADLVVTVSNYERRRIVRNCGVAWAKVKVVYNGIDCGWWQRRARWRLYCPPFQPLVVFAGRMTWQKDPFTFLEMARLVKNQLPQARFVMAGDGELLNDVKHRAWELGLGQDVSFPGFVRHEQLAEIFQHASVLVMPSRSEPFGLVALEASACEVPVVVSNCCGIREVLPELREAAPGDVGGFADATLALLRRPRDQQRAVANRLAAQRLSWQVAAQATTACYQALPTAGL